MIEHRTIEIRGLHGPKKVTAAVHGDWAVHENIDVPGLWVITILPLGFCLPPYWASFKSEEQAIQAMQVISRLRNSWSQVTQADLTLELKAHIQDIVKRYGAVQGPHAIAQFADQSPLGRKIDRANGYVTPEQSQ